MKKTLFLILGLAISFVCLWWVLRAQKMHSLIQEVRSVHWGWVLACIAVFYGGFYVRAIRWAAFFPPASQVSGGRIFGPMMMGYALNSLFPGRLGEPARAILVARREQTSIPASLSSVVAERVVDMATILGLLGLVFAFVRFGDFSYEFKGLTLNEATFRYLARKMTLFLVLPASLVIILLINARFRTLVERIIRGVPLLSAGLKAFGIHLMHSFAQGFEGLKSPRQAVLIVVYSLVVWGSGAWCIQLLAPAFSIPMSFLQAAAIMVIMCIAISLPATPGYWGLFEAGFVAGSKLLGIAASDAQLTAMALLLHLIQYVPIVLIGLVWASMSGTSMLETARSTEKMEQPAEEASVLDRS